MTGESAGITRVVATAGHVDHGKSSLVRALTGTDPDRWAEERRRGLTLDLGFAHTELASGATIAFVDVPGHVRFLSNMLAGVGAVRSVLFVVAATEAWKPQSEEHLRICELLGIDRGVIALTKVDLVDADHRWLAAAEVRERLSGSPLADAPLVEVSSTTGEGLDALREELQRLAATTAEPPDTHRARVWVDRVFSARGAGTVITGTSTHGTLRTDDRVIVGPRGLEARIRQIQTLGRVVDEIGPGRRVALNLAGIDHHDVIRGDAVVVPDRWHQTQTADVELSVLSTLDHSVSRRGAHVVHIGSAEIPARVRVLGSEALAPGSRGLVRLHLSRRVPVLPGDRFVLRDSGRSATIGGGEILDVAPRLRASKARPDRSVDRVIAEHGWITAEMLERLTGALRTPTVGVWVVDPQRWNEDRQSLIDAVTSAPAPGLVLAGLDDRGRSLLEDLVADATVEVVGEVVRLPIPSPITPRSTCSRRAAARRSRPPR
jgi:selenocysteine-specific elongation factor